MIGYRLTFNAPWIKKSITYWIVMCVLFGMLQGMRWRDCPDEKVQVSDVIEFAVAWPILIGLLITAPHNRPTHCAHP